MYTLLLGLLEYCINVVTMDCREYLDTRHKKQTQKRGTEPSVTHLRGKYSGGKPNKY